MGDIAQWEVLGLIPSSAEREGERGRGRQGKGERKREKETPASFGATKRWKERFSGRRGYRHNVK